MSTSLLDVSPSRHKLQTTPLPPPSLGYHNNNNNNEEGHLIQQLVNWLNEDRQQVPSLQHQCRVVIRRQLSVAVHFQSILPAIEQLDLPDVIQDYLRFDGPEVDLNVKKELQTTVIHPLFLASATEPVGALSNNAAFMQAPGKINMDGTQ